MLFFFLLHTGPFPKHWELSYFGSQQINLLIKQKTIEQLTHSKKKKKSHETNNTFTNYDSYIKTKQA